MSMREKARRGLGNWFAATLDAEWMTELEVISGRLKRGDTWVWSLEPWNNIVPGSFGYGDGRLRVQWRRLRSIEEQAFFEEAYQQALEQRQ